MKNNLPYWLAAIHMSGIGPRKWLQWLEKFPDTEALFQASQDEWIAAGIAPKYFATLQNPDWKAVEKDLLWAQGCNHHLVSYEDDNYPDLLKEISDPPLLLYIRGNKSACKSWQISIVGSRHATLWGLKNAEQFALRLAEAGLSIASGLALGIDAASHRGALEAKGITIGVSGTGLHHIYPASHRSLVETIVNENGAVISEFPLLAPAHSFNFPRRNRIIAGLSLGVLVVEAAIKSGSLITARHALEAGREVFAIPGSIHHPLAKGCHHLIRQGAKLVETAEDIFEELKAYPISPYKRKQVDSQSLINQLSAENRQVLAQIEYEITPMDMIISRSGLTASQVSSILLTLELAGYIVCVPGGYIRANQKT